MKSLTKTQFQTFENELEKVALNKHTEHEVGYMPNGKKVTEKYTEFLTPLNKVVFCEYETVNEEGVLCLVLSL